MKQTEDASGVHAFVATLEWLIVAFATTLVFIVFEMQAYTIPTGSMADTLRGAHFRLRCRQCAYPYDYDFLPPSYGMPSNVTPGFNVPVVPPGPRCPSCGYRQQTAERRPVTKGDRIFVLKCVYQFFEPKRWDVVVFKNPLDPQVNYIKRLVALPGETLAIIDGDIYINGEIQRKPRRTQEELWMPVYDNDYQPVHPKAGGFNGGVWHQPFVNQSGSDWNLSADSPTVFGLDAEGDRLHALVYNTRAGNDFRATYAYDDPRLHSRMPICSDLMVRFDTASVDEGDRVGVALTKYGIEYRGWVLDGRMLKLEKVHANGLIEELAAKAIAPPEASAAGGFQFANVDHMLRLEWAGHELEFDLGAGVDDAGVPQEVMPRLAILGTGQLTLFHVSIFRDIHYLTNSPDGSPILRAGKDDPFTLEDDQFFVLGDNSPASLDARWWDAPGVGNSGQEYREGVVPRDYLVGKAFFVYWPGPYKPFNDSALARLLEKNRLTRILKIFLNVPAVDGIKIIDGGA